MAATSRAVGAVSPEWRDNEIEQRGSGKDDALHADGGLGWVGSRWDLVAPTSRFQLHPMSLMRSIQTHPNPSRLHVDVTTQINPPSHIPHTVTSHRQRSHRRRSHHRRSHRRRSHRRRSHRQRSHLQPRVPF